MDEEAKKIRRLINRYANETHNALGPSKSREQYLATFCKFLEKEKHEFTKDKRIGSKKEKERNSKRESKKNKEKEEDVSENGKNGKKKSKKDKKDDFVREKAENFAKEIESNIKNHKHFPEGLKEEAKEKENKEEGDKKDHKDEEKEGKKNDEEGHEGNKENEDEKKGSKRNRKGKKNEGNKDHEEEGKDDHKKKADKEGHSSSEDDLAPHITITDPKMKCVIDVWVKDHLEKCDKETAEKYEKILDVPAFLINFGKKTGPVVRYWKNIKKLKNT